MTPRYWIIPLMMLGGAAMGIGLGQIVASAMFPPNAAVCLPKETK